ncbi:MAG: DUF3857 and transglutaminase domain-containing protein [Candidatus Latescibacterota bacterium]
MLRKLPFSALLLLLSAPILQAHVVKTHDGEEIRTETATYAHEELLLDGETAIPRERVKEIFFEMPQQAVAFPEEGEAKEIPQDVREILEQAQEQALKYPDADGIILLDDGEYVLNADGTNMYRYHFRGLILKEEKKQEWSDQSTEFDEKRERIKLLWARTILPSGKIIPLDPATAQITDPAGEGVYFGKGKVFSYTLPETGVGCIVEYAYEREEFDPFDKELFFPGFYFQAYEPVRHSRMTVTLPNTKTLNYKAYLMPEGREAPRVIREGSSTQYVWELTDVVPLIPEPSMPPYTTVVPRVEAALFETWDYIFDWLTRMQTRRIQITPEIEQAVAEITAGTTDTEEKVARIYHFIQGSIRYISIKGSIGSGWSGHEAFYTLQSKYGDCIDKSILFTTMLNVIGVTSEPIIILTNQAGVADREIPSMRGNHAITQVHLDGRDFYLDATSTTHRYPAFRGDDHGVTTINALRREIGFIAVPAPEENRRTYILKMHILPDGDARTEYVSSYVGDYEARVRSFYMYRKESDHGRMLTNMVSSFGPDATLDEYALDNVYDISRPFALHLSYTLRDYVVKAGNLRIFAIPGAKMDFSETTLPTRKYDIVYDTSFEMIHDVTITVPETYRVKYLPPEIGLETPYATYSASFTAEDDTTIIFHDTFRRTERIVPVADYAAYQTFLQKVSKYSREQLFFNVE